MPTLASVNFCMRRAPAELRVTFTSGVPLCWSTPEVALVSSEPVTMTCLLSRQPRGQALPWYRRALGGTTPFFSASMTRGSG